ncbi:MAG: diguanylate cyclase [Candidatus Sedimenticola endophacoides]
MGECLESGQPLEFEQAYDTRDGTSWWRLSLKPILDEGESVSRLLMTGQDITKKVELERQLKITSSRFASVVEAAYDCIITINQRERIVLFNKAAQELFGYHEEEVLGQCIEMLIPERYRPDHSDHVERFAHSPITSRQMEERTRVHGLHKDGTEFPVEIAISKINVGGMVEFTAIVRDIADRVRLMDQLPARASRDHLTGLLNRREFEERGAALFGTAKATGTPLSLLMIDADKFKRINDTHGHSRGDEVLRVISNVGSTTVQHRDLFARIGGEEFVVLMPETNREQALAMAERIRKIFDQQAFEHDWQGDPIPFTISVGVSSMRHGEADESIQAMQKRADIGLYRAKESGRNRVEFNP